MNTHRDFSRNSASSRAIPVTKIIERVLKDPVIPYFGENKPGMQDQGPITGQELEEVTKHWLDARDRAVDQAENLRFLNVHKQVTNRLLEPFMWHTAIISSTRWNNFFTQRCHPDAQPEMQTIAKMMLAAMKASTPAQLGEGNWHLPYITEQDVEEYPVSLLLQLSTARCARVSYLSHDGSHDPEADLVLFKRLLAGNHWSPFEHVAQAVNESYPGEYGNFDSGWMQFRKFQEKEYVH
jgi:thymidylate synthase ThyX